MAQRKTLLGIISSIALLAGTLTGCSDNNNSTTASTTTETPTSSTETTVTEEATEEVATFTKTVVEVAPADTGSCDLQYLYTELNWSEPRFHVSYCDGKFAAFGTPQTDHVAYAQWTPNGWSELKPDGETFTGFNCYDKRKLSAMGFPIEETNIILCEDSTPAAQGSASTQSSSSGEKINLDLLNVNGTQRAISRPNCDGRYILIVDSISANDPSTAKTKLEQSLAKHPGSAYTSPGQCASLRNNVDGQQVYPVYYDYAHNKESLCQSRKLQGGNGRVLTNTPDYSDPCD